MAKLRLLGVQPEIVQGLIISCEPPAKKCVLLAANGEQIAEGVMQESKAKAWAKRESQRINERVGKQEASRLGYDKPMELRIYD